MAMSYGMPAQMAILFTMVLNSFWGEEGVGGEGGGVWYPRQMASMSIMVLNKAPVSACQTCAL